MRPSISKALADDAFSRKFGAHKIIHAERGACVVTKIELREIAVQMLLAAVLINALHAALKNREVAFNRISGHVAANVFLATMIYSFVAGKFSAKLFVPSRLIGHEAGFAGNVIAHDRRNIIGP